MINKLFLIPSIGILIKSVLAKRSVLLDAPTKNKGRRSSVDAQSRSPGRSVKTSLSLALQSSPKVDKLRKARVRSKNASISVFKFVLFCLNKAI